MDPRRARLGCAALGGAVALGSRGPCRLAPPAPAARSAARALARSLRSSLRARSFLGYAGSLGLDLHGLRLRLWLRHRLRRSRRLGALPTACPCRLLGEALGRDRSLRLRGSSTD